MTTRMASTAIKHPYCAFSGSGCACWAAHLRLSKFSTSARLSPSRASSDDAAADDGAPSSVTRSALPSESKAEPWKTVLEMPARAAWRVSDPKPPLALERTQRDLLSEGGLSGKRLQQVQESTVVPAQKALAERRERERLRMVSGREYKPADQKRDAAVEPILYGPEEALASLKYRLYPNFAIARRILMESRSLVGSDAWKPTKVIDFGIGIGSASAAAVSVWKNDIEWIHGIDASQTMREGAQAVLEGFSAGAPGEPSSSSSFSASSASAPRITLSAHLSAEASLPAFDLALFAYTASDLLHGTSILAAAAILWEKLLPNGLLVMIEPGTPDGFMNVRTVRNMLLDCYPPDQTELEREECHILAPCTHNGRCPMERYGRQPDEGEESGEDEDASDDGNEREGGNGDGDDESFRKGFCSFVQTMPGNGSFLSKGEKFSYLVAQKRVRGHFVEPAHRFQGVRVSDLLQESLNQDPARPLGDVLRRAVDLESRFLDSDDDHLGLELLRGDANRSSFGRIVLAPMKRRGHVLIDCCEGPGQLVRHSVSKSMSKASPGLYAAARKSRWGGFWPSAQHGSNKGT